MNYNPDETIKIFLDNHDVEDSSRKVYNYTINYFFRWLIKTGRDATRPTRADIIAYKAQLKNTHTPNSVGLYIASLKSYFTWLASVNTYENIAYGIKTKSKTQTFAKDPLTIQQVQKLLSTTRQSIIDYRDHLIISLMYLSGLRIVEVSRIRYSDINIEQKELWIRGKGRDVKECIAINIHVVQSIEDYTQAKIDHGIHVDDDAYLVTSHRSNANQYERMRTDTISKLIGNRLKAAGVKTRRITGHSLRHSAAVHMINEGKYDLYAVQLFLRHKDSNVTRMYTQYAEKIKMGNNRPTDFLQTYLNNKSNTESTNKN
jgi:integrase/recombinase XerD